MKLVGLKPMLEQAQQQHYAVGAFNYCNAETAVAVTERGKELRSPVMFIIGPAEMPVLGPRMVVKMAEMAADRVDVPVCLHLDHAADVELVKECIDAGFPSVMIDASAHDFEENVRITRTVVEMAHPKGITVEGELGAVGRVGAAVEGGHTAVLTDPSKAAEFVERTGVDALAVAIGNAHGIYTQQPELDIELLRAIREVTHVPLVLHGGSCTPTDQLQNAVQAGISKVNVASELSRAYFGAMRAADSEGKGWYAMAIVEAMAAIRQIVARWMKELGSTNRIP